MAAATLTLGPVLFHWPAERLLDFYRRIADEAPVARVHVGEVVCGKRMPFSDQCWPEVIERLERAGKEVVLATLAAPATVRERRVLAELCGDDRMVEINDITALPARTGRPFVTGPLLNVYNEATARFFAGHGARAICPPVELSMEATGAMAQACPEIEFELFAFGRLPLAISGRCYHARLHGLHKDSCQFTCEQDPDGLAVDTLDGQAFLAINGVQTLSNQVQAFCPEPDTLSAQKIARLRLSPHSCDMVAVAEAYRALLDGEDGPAATRAKLACLDLPGEMVEGYAHGRPGWMNQAAMG
jgi:collagenase-like PrtC family protease